MANQGNQGNQGNRDREGNLGQSGNDMNSPTGTSGREGDGNRQTGNDTSREPARRKIADDDEDSPLGNRATNR